MKIILTNKLIKEKHAVKNKVYIDKVFIVLSATSDGVCTISSLNAAGASIAMAGGSWTLIFSLT